MIKWFLMAAILLQLVIVLLLVINIRRSENE